MDQAVWPSPNPAGAGTRLARPPLTVFTPLPPERNGIADYAHLLLGGLASHYACRAACEDWLAAAPAGVAVVDAALGHRAAAPHRVLHQIGNNPGHGFALRALRATPGVTTLHDPGLLHLHDLMGTAPAAIRAGMVPVLPALGPAYARHHRDAGIQTRANHLLFDLAGEVLARSRAVVVHSAFARNRLRLAHGAAATAHVVVIPHPLPSAPMPDRAAARARLGIPPECCLVVTAGFATAAKRLDWVVDAVGQAIAAGAALRWIHAGAERGEEFALAAAIAARPALAGHAGSTGYLTDAALDDHIAAADVLVNLRFPSAGESSGSLARAFAAGTCCIVSDTAGYAELPRDAVVAVPLADSVGVLARVLRAVAADPAQAWAIGDRGRRWARAEMALPAVAARYREVIEASLDRPVAADQAPAAAALVVPAAAGAAGVAAALAGRRGRCRLLLTAGLDALAALSLAGPPLLAALLPPGTCLRAATVRQAPEPGLLLDLELGE